MNLSLFRFFLVSFALVAMAACTVMDLEEPAPEDQVLDKARPEFPPSEYAKGRQGWVKVGFVVARSGLILDIGILESSGSEAFEQAALKALQDWRFAPGEQRHYTAVVNFVFDYSTVRLSRRFASLNARAHKLIDKGDLDGAEQVLVDIRSHASLSAFELAYSYLTEGRIAGERGDYTEQLTLFRKAAQNDGHWLDRRNYLACLRAMVIMEIDQQDYVSAVRDYELLAESSVGRKMGKDLKAVVNTIDAQLRELEITEPPFMIADANVTVMRDTPVHAQSVGERPPEPRPGVRSPPRPRKRN